MPHSCPLLTKKMKIHNIVRTAVFIILVTCANVRAETTVGVIVPLSGPYAHFGEAGRIGIELALPPEQAKKSGIRFVYEDSQYDATKSISAYTKLVELDKSDLLIVLGSPPATAIIPLARKKQIPLFVWTPSKRITAGETNVIRLMSSAAEQGQKMATEVLSRGYTSVAFFSSQNEFSQSIRDSFISDVGPEIIKVNEEFVPEEQDFRSVLMQIKSKDVKAIGICLNTGQIPQLFRQMQQLQIELPVFGCHAMSSLEVLSAMNGSKSSGWFVEGLITPAFQESFAGRSNDSSGIWVAAAFHDAVSMLKNVSIEKTLITDLISNPVSNSALGSSRVIKGPDDIYLAYSLGVTSMKDSSFHRSAN